VHWPEEESCQAAMAGFNTAYRHHPGAVVVARGMEDVRETVAYARQHGLTIALLATGHGVHRPIETDLVVSLRELRQVRVDPESATATVAAGAVWSSVYAAAAPHGLVPVSGSSPTVGVIGYLLGGGLGPLARSHGFSSDYLEELLVLTGQGRLVRASQSENSELFWALRGGRSGLGVVLEAKLRLVRLPHLQAGRLHYDGRQLEALLSQWIPWSQRVPSSLTSSLAFARRPGGLELALRVAFPDPEPCPPPPGSLTPRHGSVEPREPSYLATLHQDPTEPMPLWVSGLFLSRLDQAFVRTLSQLLQRHPTLVGVELRHLGGAARTGRPEGSAVGGGEADFAAALVWRPAVELFEQAHVASEAELRETLQPWAASHTNINFCARLRDRAHFESAWPELTHQRLESLRSHYDPHGVFAYHGF
jgi:FAD/FMN-containing dehydrogenase